MAGGLVKYRHLSRNSSARKALLRGLVTQLVQHEHIQTTHAKAKEAQRLAEKLITLAKRNNEPCRRSAQGILYTPHILLPKLFGELRNRYLTREGGYTRVVRTEPKNTYDQGESSILEFVDGPKDSRFMMTAKALARDRLRGRDSTPLTKQNKKKVTQFRGEEDLEQMVQRFMTLETADEDGTAAVAEAKNTEAAKMAERESAAVQGMAAGIVPESAKKASGEPEQPTR
ncbi:54S ribosomal protein L8, mitochondrial [Tolypocladium ophioglossoides CBS 100239]|uniref:54S ribosomal protein L8, mitochondrial n=1 Tax=Tolypocladium ophioglossoides (strain CBS 100239) TaxID=1163406 RepID=A0A0L0N704_TOLOC|nr:54S ribosomal protein L8, mitochondrial [Tolypocladium ophioglossoides CBS 100239]